LRPKEGGLRLFHHSTYINRAANLVVVCSGVDKWQRHSKTRPVCSIFALLDHSTKEWL